MEGEEELKGKKIAVYLARNGYRFSGLCVSETPMFICIDDTISKTTKAFARSELSGYEVLK